MAGVRNKPEKSGKYKGWYTDARGKTKHFTGTKRKVETRRMAERIEDEARQIRLGYRPAPSSAARHRTRDLDEVASEYIVWGADRGGLGGRPWSEEYRKKVERGLRFWFDRLGLASLADLDGILAKVEKVLSKLSAKGLAPKTLSNRVNYFRAFCNWAVERGMLEKSPLDSLGEFDTTPQTTRRELTSGEIEKLLDVVPAHRRLLYQTALCSGLRASELRALRVTDLDVERGGLRLRAEITKNRQSGFQPLPAALVEKLADFVTSGTASELYEKYPQADAPEDPLLHVPSHTSRRFAKDCGKADIAIRSFGGKVDFHALRVTYTSAVLAEGTDIKTAQTLARHATPNLTLNTYGRAREQRLAEVAERVGKHFLKKEGDQKDARDIAVCLPLRAV